MNSKQTLRDWLQGIENIITAAIIKWITQRRGIEFIYWMNPDEWDAYMHDEEIP